MDQAKSIIGGLAVLIIVFGGLLWFANRKTSSDESAEVAQSTLPASAGDLASEERSYDFGTISMSAGKVSHQFTVKNTGLEPVRVGKVYTSCMCTSASVTDAGGKRYGEFGMQGHGGMSASTDIEVGAGQVVTVEVVFDPAAHGPSGVGLAQRTVYLETNSQKSPKLELGLQARVTR